MAVMVFWLCAHAQRQCSPCFSGVRAVLWGASMRPCLHPRFREVQATFMSFLTLALPSPPSSLLLSPLSPSLQAASCCCWACVSGFNPLQQPAAQQHAATASNHAQHLGRYPLSRHPRSCLPLSFPWPPIFIL